MSAKNKDKGGEERLTIQLVKLETGQVSLVLGNVYVEDRVTEKTTVTVYVTDAHAEKISYFLDIPIEQADVEAG